MSKFAPTIITTRAYYTMNRILSSLLLILVLTSLSLPAWGRGYNTNAEYPFIIITPEDTEEMPEISDEDFYTMSTSVIFKVNKTNIHPDDPFFKLYQDEILPLINQRHLQLRKIYVRGAASPEGPYENNRRLGQGRSKALLEALKSQLRNQYKEIDSEVCSVTEDYGNLCILMKEAGDAEYDAVQKIYDDCKGDELSIKQKLMNAQGGTLWKRLLKEYFPQLRSARLILWFSEPDEAHAPLSEIAQLKRGPLTFIELPKPKLAPLNLDAIAQTTAPWPTDEGMVQGEKEKHPRRHLIAVRTNLLHDFFYMPQFGWAMSPNVQLEYYPLDGHYTYNAAFTWSNHRHWEDQQFFQVRDLQLELRRYFVGEGKFIGPYLGAYLEGNVYGIGLSKTKGWQGEGWGGGLDAGWVVKLNKKGNFRMEFNVSVGYLGSKYDPYVYGNPVSKEENGKYYYDYLGSAKLFKKRNHMFTWFGPTNLGISLTYDIIYRKKHSVQKGDKQ